MRVRTARGGASPLLLDGRADIADRRTGRIHLLRITRDIEAHGTVQAVRLPFHDIPGRVAPCDKTVLVAFVPGALAPAEAGDIAEYLRMLGSKDVCGSDDVRRTGRCVGLERKRRQVRLFMWFERHRWCSLSSIRCRRAGGRSGFGGCDISDAARVRKTARNRHDDDQGCDEQRRRGPLAGSRRLGGQRSRR